MSGEIRFFVFPMRHTICFLLLFMFVSCEKKELVNNDSLNQLKRIEKLIEKNRNTLLNNDNEKKLLRKELNELKGKTDTTALYCMYLLSKSAISNYNSDSSHFLDTYYLSCIKTKDSLSYARYYRLKGILHYRSSDMNLAIENYLKSEKILKKINNGDEYFEVKLNIAQLLNYINDFTGAEMYLAKINTLNNDKIHNDIKIRVL
ncbi:MAG: hypothetical protein RLZZ500_1040, partial [Bacteroidota bacterium]